MSSDLQTARENFIQGMSRISHFWGFSKAMGAIFGALYLSPDPLSLDDLVVLAGVTKGAVSTNVRALERLGLVHRHIQIGERKDYYVAETDFWKIVKGILRERQKSEFDHALRSVGESLEMVEAAEAGAVESGAAEDVRLAAFYRGRLQNIQRFFGALDNLVATLLALDELRLGALERLLGARREEKRESKSN